MSNGTALLLDALGGAAGGLFFFGGLWWTIKCGLRSTRPALWFLASLLVRSGVLVLGLIWIGHYAWTRMLAALLGVITMRFIVRRVICTPQSGVSLTRHGAVP